MTFDSVNTFVVIRLIKIIIELVNRKERYTKIKLKLRNSICATNELCDKIKRKYCGNNKKQ